MTTEKKKSFLLYAEQEELINELSNEEAGKLFKEVFHYVKTGETPNLSGMMKMAFITIRQDLDRNAQKYDEMVEKRRIAGSMGGKQRVENQIQANQANATFATTASSKSSKSSYNDNDNDNDNVNANDNRNENDNVNVNENVISSSSQESPSSEKSSYIKSGKYGEVDEKTREIIEKYVRKKGLATKNVRGYVNTIIKNGDYEWILKEATKKKKTKEEIIREQIASIHCKDDAARVLCTYYAVGDFPPVELDKYGDMYDLDCYDKVYNYYKEKSEKQSE